MLNQMFTVVSMTQKAVSSVGSTLHLSAPWEWYVCYGVSAQLFSLAEIPGKKLINFNMPLIKLFFKRKECG